MPLALRPLTDHDLHVVDPWFEDPETRRWLGDSAWPRGVLRLDVGSDDHFAYLAMRVEEPVGLVDVERYEDRRGSFALAVAPEHRRRGIGSAMVALLTNQVELASVIEFFAGVEKGNVASAALLRRAGFDPVDDHPDEEGFRYFASRPDGQRVRRPWSRPRR